MPRYHDTYNAYNYSAHLSYRFLLSSTDFSKTFDVACPDEAARWPCEPDWTVPSRECKQRRRSKYLHVVIDC